MRNKQLIISAIIICIILTTTTYRPSFAAPSAIMVDLNGDGVGDTKYMDSDGDGKADFIVQNWDGSGWHAGIKDTDNNGKYDTIWRGDTNTNNVDETTEQKTMKHPPQTLNMITDDVVTRIGVDLNSDAKNDIVYIYVGSGATTPDWIAFNNFDGTIIPQNLDMKSPNGDTVGWYGKSGDFFKQICFHDVNGQQTLHLNPTYQQFHKKLSFSDLG